MNSPLSPLLLAVCAIARDAGEAILAVYREDFEVTRKDDASPVTAADFAAHKVITQGLSRLSPRYPVLSEEASVIPWNERRQWPCYWLVDPLDGTREFIKRNGEFTVNIALIGRHRPILGVVYAPVSGDLFAAEQGAGAWWQTRVDAEWEALRSRELASPVLVAGSRSHGTDAHALLNALLGDAYTELPLGSSLKFCLIARGAADLYLRCGPTSEWDTAAAQCVLEEAGGAVLDLVGEPLRYNCHESLRNPEFLAVGDTDIDWRGRLLSSLEEYAR